MVLLFFATFAALRETLHGAGLFGLH